MRPVFASPTSWTTWHLPPTRCLRFRLSRWSFFSSVFIHNIYRESSSNALLSFIFEAADGWFLHQSSRNRCLAALREELTLYETFPKWAHLPRSASQQKPPSASGAALSNPPPSDPNPSHLNSNPLLEPTLSRPPQGRGQISIIMLVPEFRNSSLLSSP